MPKVDRGGGMRLRSFNKVIENAQHNRATHDKYLQALKEIYEQTKHEEFMEKFQCVLLQIFLRNSKNKNPYDIRTLEFLAKFCVKLQDNEGNNPFLSRVVNFILQFNNSQDHNVRYHICEFIKLLMSSLAEIVNGIIDDEVCDEIVNAMKERINDIKPNIRHQAVLALQRLQDPSNIDDPVTKIYIRSIMIECNSLVRKSLIQCMCSTAKTIQIILSSCLDKDEMIQLASFDKISKVPVYLLKVEQRHYILRNGFRSNSPKIIKCLNDNLLPKWIDHYKGDYLELIKALLLDSNETDIKNTVQLIDIVLESLFKTNPKQNMLSIIQLNDDKLLPLNNLKFESVLYWRCLLQYLHKGNEEDGYQYIEKLMPDLSKLVSLIEKFHATLKQCKTEWDYLIQNQILSELLKMLLLYDMLDETGRKDCHSIITNRLMETKITNENFELLIKIFKKIIPNVDERCIEICLLISNIREPLIQVEPTTEDLKKRDLKLAPFQVKINILTDNMEQAVKEEEFMKASDLKVQISAAKQEMQKILDDFENEFSSNTQKSDVNDDPKTISHCLDILIAFLEYDDELNKLNDTLTVCLDQFVKPLLKNNVPILHAKVFKCFALFCYLDKSLAAEYIQLFCSPMLIYRYMGQYSLPVLTICCQIVTDFIILFGSKIFGENNEDEPADKTKKRTRSLYDNSQLSEDEFRVIPSSATSNIIIEILSEMLDDSEAEIREVSGVCLIKLMMNNIVSSSVILSKLLIKWFNPLTKRDQYLLQLLGHFFENYIKHVPGSDSVVEAAFIPTLKTVANAPLNSPLIDINLDSLIKFLAGICKLHSHNRSNELYMHKNLLLSLGNEILQKSTDSKEIPLYLKSLLTLDIPYDDNIIMQDLKKQADDILTYVQDKNQQKLVQKYKDKLNEIESPTVNNTETTINGTTLSESVSRLSVSSNPVNNNKKRKRSMLNEERNKSTLPSISENDENVCNDEEDNIEIEVSSPESPVEPAPDDIVSASESDTENQQLQQPILRRSMRKHARKN